MSKWGKCAMSDKRHAATWFHNNQYSFLIFISLSLLLAKEKNHTIVYISGEAIGKIFTFKSQIWARKRHFSTEHTNLLSPNLGICWESMREKFLKVHQPKNNIFLLYFIYTGLSSEQLNPRSSLHIIRGYAATWFSLHPRRLLVARVAGASTVEKKM